MNYIILILVGVAGVVVGSYFGVQKKRKSGLIFGQAKKKRENKENILEYLKKNEKIANDDVERLCGVSDATATRYLSKLENEGKIKQIGTVGHAVYYRLIKP